MVWFKPFSNSSSPSSQTPSGPNTRVIDSWEDQDFSEYSAFTGSLSNWTTVDGSTSGEPAPVSGTYEAKGSNPSDGSFQGIISTSGLNYYPDRGDWVKFWIYFNGGDIRDIIFFATDSNNCYRVLLNPSGPLERIRKFDGGTLTTLVEKTNSLPTGEYLEGFLYADPATHRLWTAIYDAAGDNVVKLQAVDSTFDSGGWGILTEGKSGSNTFTDFHNSPQPPWDTPTLQGLNAAVYPVQGPQARYVSSEDMSFFVWHGNNSNPYAAHYDYSTETLSSKANIGSDPLVDDDYHSVPALAIDSNGYLHTLFGSHGNYHEYARSTNAYDATAWNTQSTLDTVPKGTYPNFIFLDGSLYSFYRTWANTHSDTYPSHQFGTIIKSSDGGSSWTDIGPVIDSTGHPDSVTDVYPFDMQAANGRIHLTWLIAHGSSHDDTRGDVYHAYYDPSDGNMYDLNGTSYGSKITWSEHSDGVVKALDLEPIENPYAIVDGNKVHISVWDQKNGRLLYLQWDGSAWSTETVLSNGVPGSIRLDGNGTPQIHRRGHTGSAGGYYTVSYRDGGTWKHQTVTKALRFQLWNTVRGAPDDRHIAIGSEGDNTQTGGFANHPVVITDGRDL